MTRWAIALALALASAGGGIAAKGQAPQGAAPDAFAWLSARGLAALEESRPLGGAEGHRLHLMAAADGFCVTAVVPLDSAEEILPVLRRQLPADAWAGAFLWLGDLRPGVPHPAWLQARRIWLRMRDGVAPRPALLLAGPGCAPVLGTG